MASYTFNSELIQKLHINLQRTLFSISNDITSCSYDTLKRYIRSGNPRIETFVEICNEYHLNFRDYFVSSDPSNWTVDSGTWVPLEFHDAELRRYELMAEKIRCCQLAIEMSRKNNKVEKLFTGGYFRPNEPKKDEQKKETKPFTPSKQLGEWKYNSVLFKSLPTITGIYGKKLFDPTSHYNRTYEVALNAENIPVRTLVDLCNARRLNILCFFIREGEPELFHDVVIPDGEFDDIEFRPDNLRSLSTFRDKDGKSIGDLTKLIGYTYHNLKIMCDTEQSPMRATELARLCNILNVQPSFFFKSAHMVRNDNITRKMQEDIDKLTADRDAAQREANNLRAKLRHLEAMMNMDKNSR